jgi:hypothetical protein
VVNHTAIRFVLRAHLVNGIVPPPAPVPPVPGLYAAATGLTTLAATATGWTRAAGSFLADGFDLGMEATPAGFGTNTRRVIRSVSALEIKVDGADATPVPVEAAGAGRSLSALLPSRRAWENIEFKPTVWAPSVEEQYLPGPSSQETLGPGGDLEHRPTVVYIIRVPANTGLSGARYADAFLRHLPPRLKLPLPDGNTLMVRGDHAPYQGQLLPAEPGFAAIPVTVPCRLRTANII